MSTSKKDKVDNIKGGDESILTEGPSLARGPKSSEPLVQINLSSIPPKL